MNYKKIIFFNFIAVFIIYACFELYTYSQFCKSIGFSIPFFQISEKDTFEFYPPERFISLEKAEIKNNIKYEKPPILMIGCSYTWGELLPENETPEAKITKLTGRFVYNWGISGHGPIPQISLFNLEHKYHLLKEKPEYVIYTYMFHHPERLWCIEKYNVLRKEKLIPSQPYNILYNSYLYRKNKDHEFERLYNNFEMKYELFLNVVKLLKQKSEQEFPGSKFVMLLYSDINKDLCEGLQSTTEDIERNNKLFDLLYSKEFRKTLEDMGIIVISTEELTRRKMDKTSDRIPNDPNHPHPSSSAWDEIIPKLVQRLNL